MEGNAVDKAVKGLSEFFYDVIVYFSSGAIVVTALLLTTDVWEKIGPQLLPLTGGIQLLAIFFLLCVFFVYGQMASTFSEVLIKRPISVIVRKFAKDKADDFLFSYSKDLRKFTLLNKFPKKVERNYWTVLYWLKIHHPSVAADLIKRYARVKLARVNAFNCLVFCIACFVEYVLSRASWYNINIFKYDTVVLGLLFSCLLVIFAMEFYKRQCWFGDILIKTLAAVEGRDDSDGH